MKPTATFSEDRKYRYDLRRFLRIAACPSYCVFIGLNPSTADETNNDPTVRRCIDFAKRWGYDAMVMLNLFAFRATDPAVMKREPEPIGADNDSTILEWAGRADRIVCCWGNHGRHLGRGNQVRELLREFNLHCFRITGGGQPVHPLYLLASSPVEKMP